MKKYRLSDRAKVLLVLISERTEVENGDFSNPTRFFVPPDGYKTAHLKTVWLRKGSGCSNGHNTIFIDGSGDASTLRSLERKGLTLPHHVVAYAYSVTEEGRVEAERILSANEIGTRIP